MNDKVIRFGALFGMMAVISGAFGAHGLKNLVDDHSLEIWNKAVLYQFIHAIALVLIGILCLNYNNKLLNAGAVLFGAGILMFSGSLYILAIRNIISFNIDWAGPITPLGGIAFIAGWGCMFAGSQKKYMLFKN